MELIRIGDQKMKIMLTYEDMTQYELNGEDLNEGGEQIRRAFRVLMEDIRQRTGFSLDDRQISVQYFPSREGGCEMFISGLQPKNDENKKSVNRALTLHPGKQPEKLFRFECATVFFNMESLLLVCKRLLSIGYSGESSAFSDDLGQYHLILQTVTAAPFSAPEELLFLAEYGKTENLSIFRHTLPEHGSPICLSGAVTMLGKLI